MSREIFDYLEGIFSGRLIMTYLSGVGWIITHASAICVAIYDVI